MLFRLQEKAELPGLIFPKDLISQDVSTHVEFVFWFYLNLEKKVSPKPITRMVSGAGAVQTCFGSTRLFGLNCDGMRAYTGLCLTNY